MVIPINANFASEIIVSPVRNILPELNSDELTQVFSFMEETTMTDALKLSTFVD